MISSLKFSTLIGWLGPSVFRHRYFTIQIYVFLLVLITSDLDDILFIAQNSNKASEPVSTKIILRNWCNQPDEEQFLFNSANISKLCFYMRYDPDKTNKETCIKMMILSHFILLIRPSNQTTVPTNIPINFSESFINDAICWKNIMKLDQPSNSIEIVMLFLRAEDWKNINHHIQFNFQALLQPRRSELSEWTHSMVYRFMLNELEHVLLNWIHTWKLNS